MANREKIIWKLLMYKKNEKDMYEILFLVNILRTSEKISPKQILELMRNKKILKIRHLRAIWLANDRIL